MASGRAMSSGLRDTSYEPLPTSRPGVKKFMAGCNVLKTRNTTVAEGNEETQETGLRLKDSLAHHPLEAAARSSAVTRYPRTQPISPGMPPEARLLSTLVFLHHQSRNFSATSTSNTSGAANFDIGVWRLPLALQHRFVPSRSGDQQLLSCGQRAMLVLAVSCRGAFANLRCTLAEYPSM